MKKTLLTEINKIRTLAGLKLINEIDFERFADIKDANVCIPDEEIVNKLNEIIRKRDSGESTVSKTDPYIHNKAARRYIVNDNIDVNLFINDITKTPHRLFGINSKMEKTETEESFTVNVGLPAFKGVVYDEDARKFLFVKTCPGAGACVKICYALSGNYIRLDEVAMRLTRTLNLFLNHTDLFEMMLIKTLEDSIRGKGNKTLNIRWNDSGDFFTKEYQLMAQRVTQKLRNKNYRVNSYAYTKVADVHKTADQDLLHTIFSMDASEFELAKFINKEYGKRAYIVKPEVFADLFTKKGKGYIKDASDRWAYKDPNGPEILKQKIADEFGVNKDNLLSHDEYLKNYVNKPGKYNVIIISGESDTPAMHKNVDTIYLLQH